MVKRIRAKLKDGRVNNGGWRGGTRPKGSTTGPTSLVNLTAKAIREWAFQSGEMPHVFALRVMRGEEVDDYKPTFADRMEAARMCAPYLVPRLSHVQHTGEDGGAIKTQTNKLDIDVAALRNLSDVELDILDNILSKLSGVEVKDEPKAEPEGDGDAYARSLDGDMSDFPLFHPGSKSVQ